MALKDHYSHITLPLPKIDTGQQLASDYAECRRIMHQASKNYTFASHFLPDDKRQHVEALYAVMRIGDDRVDVSHQGFQSPLAAIEEWRDSYWRAFEKGDSPYPVLRAYLHTSHQFNISPALLAPYFRAMIDDLSIKRFDTFDDLLYYMEGSAITVGRIMTHILGTTSGRASDAFPGADALSIAMQLSNFWRDVGQDWGIGRVYIPQEDLERFQYTETDLANQVINPNFIDLMEYQIERTEAYYRQAESAIPLLASGQWGVMSGLAIYRAILHSIRDQQYDVFSERAEASTWQKLKLVAQARWQTL